jgi:hypothetical protein
MAPQTKPIALVKGHRTKAEIAVRQKAENELLTGSPLKESTDVKKMAVAHKEFIRLRKLLQSIGKNDDLYGSVINMHCLLVGECSQIDEVKQKFINTLDEFNDRCLDENMEYPEIIQVRMQMQSQILGCDKALMAKRKMLLDIGKENILTIASALRSIPKKEAVETESPMSEFLKRRQAAVSEAQQR